MSTKSLLIVGSGPGIAQSSAIKFASQGFTHLFLVSRSASSLSAVASSIQSSTLTVEISTYPCDVNDTLALSKTLSLVTSDLPGDTPSPEVILFNAAAVQPSTLGATDPEVLVSDFRTTTVAMYQTAAHFLPLMAKSASASMKPTFLLTSSFFHHIPFAPYFSLSIAKAAQFNLAGSLAQVFGPQGVHFGVTSVNGQVQADGPLAPENIAGKLWELYEEGGSGDGTLQVTEIGDVPGVV